MIDLQSLRLLQIKKGLIEITLFEKKQVITKTFIFLGIFVLAVFIMGILQTAHSNSQITDLGLMAGIGLLKFSGIFFWTGAILVYRVYSLNEKIRSIEKEIDQINQDILHLNN